jgi:hypothetical protein
MRPLPEAATAALSQWNACSAPILQSLRNLPAPTRQEIVSLFNEEGRTNVIAAAIRHCYRLRSTCSSIICRSHCFLVRY